LSSDAAAAVTGHPSLYIALVEVYRKAEPAVAPSAVPTRAVSAAASSLAAPGSPTSNLFLATGLPYSVSLVIDEKDCQFDGHP
jgi:hypothetical protein